MHAGLENFYFDNFEGNVILFFIFNNVEENKLRVERYKIYANSGRGSAVFCAFSLWPLIPGPGRWLPGSQRR